MSSLFRVGAMVRVSRSDLPKVKAAGRATIATIQAEEKTACVLFEPITPKPLFASASSSSSSDGGGGVSKKRPKRRLKRSFLITPPLFKENDINIEQDNEATVDISDMRALLDFEQGDAPKAASEEGNEIAAWKERGDQLLRLGDPSAACSYYEMALRLSSILQIGSSVIVKEGGHAKLADVDCLDEDDEDCIEITMVDSGEEKVVKEKEILLCILYIDAKDEGHKQERILLNLARCLLQLAELAKHQEMASDRRPRYLRSSVLAATLVLTIAEHHKEDSNISSMTALEQTALLLRSQAQAGLAKFPNAIADMKRLLSSVPQHKEGLKQMQSVQAQMQRQKQVDKKLVKSMCKLVQTAATDSPVSNSGDDPLEESDSPRFITGSAPSVHDKADTAIPTNVRSSVPYNLVVYLILPVLFAYIIQDILG